MLKVENVEVYGWEDIKGYEGIYNINTKGDVKSVRNNKILKQFTTKCGYKSVELNLNGKAKKFLIHRLVAETFITNSNNKPHVNHKDGNKSNNDVSNLEWVTRSENMHHAYDNNLAPKGEKNVASKLKEWQVKWIKSNYIKGDEEFGQSALGRKFNVDRKAIASIVNGKTWKEII